MTSPCLPARPPLPARRTSDVIVIGGGAVGLSVAVHLRWLGATVTVLERDRTGSGTSSRDFGLVSALDQRPTPYLRLMLAAQAYYPAWVDRLGCPGAYSVSGAIALLRDEQERGAWEMVAAEQRELPGYDAGTLLDADELRGLAPGLSSAFPWGVHRPGDAQVEPQALLDGLRAAAVREGVDIIDGARVVTTAFERGAWRVSSSAGTHEAATAVNCAGVWSERLARLVGASLPVRPVRGQTVTVDPGEIAVPVPLTWGGGLDVRQARDGRLWLRTVEQVDSWDLETHEDDTLATLDRVGAALPAVAMRPVREVFAGLRPVPADGLPLVGRLLHVPGYFAAVGGGLSLCGVEGRALASQIVEGTVDPLLEPFAPDRPMPGWHAPEGDGVDLAEELGARARRHGMRLDATDWSRVATIASRSGEAATRLARAAAGRDLPASSADPA